MKERIDVYLVANGLCESRAKAQALVMSGLVYFNEQKVLKSSQPVPDGVQVTVRDNGKKFASRGGLKLEKALASFSANVDGQICLDIGAATGGFTDVLLRAGARHVYAIDVGYGQLDWRLRNDARVTVMEHVNARYLKPQDIDAVPTVTVMDVSFISIQLILPVAAHLMQGRGVFYTLVKPQFEAGRDAVGKNGVVSDEAAHRDVLRALNAFTPSFDYRVAALDYSPITGPKGNIEFLAHIMPIKDATTMVSDDDIAALVSRAHSELRK